MPPSLRGVPVATRSPFQFSIAYRAKLVAFQLLIATIGIPSKSKRPAAAMS
jgi:hypothetical protein